MKNNIKKSIMFILFFGLCLLIPYKSYAAENTVVSNSGNNYPIVMVHGLFGWGKNELFGINYWGGTSSISQDLNNQGYEVYTPTVGSVSSNWDRACELYAYIKGGTVDYGAAHSQKYGHARYGRMFPGILPEWGTLSKTQQIQKIHLIGHSMGGQTVRVLTQLLENGDLNEIVATPKDTISPLFTGGKHWICSITTIATPHDGSQESHKMYNIEPYAHDFIAAIAAQGGLTNSTNPCFDFKLDQWGLKKEPGETFESYSNRVFSSNIWKSTTDLSVWDLTPEGARALNTWVKAQNDVYYFSIACVDTHQNLLTHYQVPNINMNPILLQSSYYLGSFINNQPGDVQIDSTWWKNDGIVSFVSATCPKVGSTDRMVNYNGTAQKGVWNFLGTESNVDHIAIVGLNHDEKSIEQKYFDLAKMLKNLPKN